MTHTYDEALDNAAPLDPDEVFNAKITDYWKAMMRGSAPYPKTIEEDPMPTSDEYYDPFSDIARELIELHDRKGKDYGSKGDPYKNIRNSEEFGFPAWIGTAMRMNDKMKRLQTAATQWVDTGDVNLANEGLIDTARDMAVYGIILEIMLTEWFAERGHGE